MTTNMQNLTNEIDIEYSSTFMFSNSAKMILYLFLGIREKISQFCLSFIYFFGGAFFVNKYNTLIGSGR